MTALLPVNINGIEYQAHAEYTRGPIVAQYEEQLKVFQNLEKLGISPPFVEPVFPEGDLTVAEIRTFTDAQIAQKTGLSEITVSNRRITAYNANTAAVKAFIESNPSYTTNMQTAIWNLIQFAKFGIPDENDVVNPLRPHFLTMEMSHAVDQLIKTLIAAGANIPMAPTSASAITITTDVVLKWKNLVASSDAVRRILSFASDSALLTNRSLQALIELVYVKTGNEIITTNLGTLEKALASTQDSLKILEQLQVLHNKIETTESGTWYSGAIENSTTIKANNVTYAIGITASIGDAPNLAWDSIQAEIAAGRWGQAYAKDGTGPLQALGALAYDFLKGGGKFVLNNNVAGIATPTVRGDFEGFAADLYSKGFVNKDVFIDGLDALAKQFFKPLDPTVPIDSISSLDRALFLELRKQLIRQISTLSRTTPTLDDGREDGNSLLGQIRNVYNNIEAAITAAGGLGDDDRVTLAMRMWILDNEQSKDNSGSLRINGIDTGSIQRNITAALTAGTSLNDQQKEEVRRYLFVFEEYYKSAAAILNKITQILERMAQAIAR